MKKQEALQRLRIDKLDNSTVFIQNRYFNFSYTYAAEILREEHKDKYRYFGGLQCDYPEGSDNYRNLENWLIELAEKVLI